MRKVSPAVKPYGPRVGTVTSALLNYVREEGSATQEELAKVFSLTKRQVRTRLDRHLYNDVIQLAYITTRAGEKMLREKKHELS